MAKQEFSIAYKAEGKILAVASVKRDLQNLKAEVAMEADDAAALNELLGDKAAAEAGR